MESNASSRYEGKESKDCSIRRCAHMMRLSSLVSYSAVAFSASVSAF